nr:pre mRNA splicing factor CWC25 [Hymenolepis microstoma]
MSLVKEVENLPSEERRKITEIIKASEGPSGSCNGSKQDSSTSWMYEQPKRSGEDFLLGKAIKSLEELAEINRDQEEETPTQRLTRLDMEAKFREDPLNRMRQHEMDKRSALLQNTARMKKLQKLIEMQNAAKEKAEKRKEKKRSKKEHRKQKHRVSDSSSSSSEDDEILEKFISLVKKVDKVKNGGNGDCSVSEKSKSEKSDKKEKKHKHKHKHRHTHHSSKKNKKSSENPEPSEDIHLKLISGGPLRSSKERDRSRHRSRSVSPKRVSGRPLSRCDDSDRDPYRRRYAKSPPMRNRSPPRGRRPRSRSRDLSRNERKRRRTQEEMAALRDQMAADAKEREAERIKRFEQHQHEKAKEENEEGQARVRVGASFLRGLTLKHVASTSVEEVIQSHANKRQRGGMDQNFLRR